MDINLLLKLHRQINKDIADSSNWNKKHLISKNKRTKSKKKKEKKK